MSKILQDVHGVFYVAHQFEKLAKEDAEQLLEQIKADAVQLETFLEQAVAGKVTPPVETPAPEQPAQATPAAPVEQPAAPDGTSAAPEPPVAQPAAPEAPAPADQPTPAAEQPPLQ